MTNMPSVDETVLKTDTRGRVLTPPERREKLLEEFERSGLSGAKFAALAGIKYQTFAAWVTRRRKQHGVAPAPVKAVDPVHWLEAVVSDAKTPACAPVTPVKLRWPTGIWIEVGELSQVRLAAALAQALEKPSAPC
jgi:DNA-binding transcriptional regulator YiaG